MASLQATDFTISGHPQDGGLTIALTRFCLVNDAVKPGGERLSLLFIHGVSYHKETWIPTIEHLFELQATVPSNTFSIIEAWAMDSPNHGGSAILNDTKLLAYPNGLTAHSVARGIQEFLKSGLYAGSSMVGIAHSASVSAISLSTLGYATDNLPYSSLVLVEPPIMTREVFARATKKGKAWEILIEMARNRKDIWPSRDAARAWMAKRLPWSTWTPRCLDLFVEHALRDLPTAIYPDHTHGVTLCCTRDQEVGGYSYNEDGFDSLDRLKDVCPAIPVHCVFGEREDVIPEFVKSGFVDESQGRKMASITTVANAGHLVVEEGPQNLALAIWGSIHQGFQPKIRTMSRL
ncbi:alpha/beta-hydrolase [Earliella scabrosa]|nr:alpha/beta-hydrolase [Earliella scabrosa]